MTSGVILLSQLLDRISAPTAAARDAVRRLRYQRSALRGLATGRTLAAGSAPQDTTSRWTAPLQLGGRSHVALACALNTRIAFDVTTGSGATVVSWVALSPGVSTPGAPATEFQIEVEANGLHSAARCSVDGGRPSHWRRLRVLVPAAGPCRITLSATTSSAAREPSGGRAALWGDPSVETPRSLANLAAVVRSRLRPSAIWRGPVSDERLYPQWIRHTRPSNRELRAQRQWGRSRSRSLSLITFVASPADWPDERTAASLTRQTYPHWEWIVAASEESCERARRRIDRLSRERRIRIVPVPSTATRAEAWNSACRVAAGDFAGVMGSDDALSPSALYEIAAAIERNADADVLYSDEDRIARQGWHRSEPQFKPDWSPELLLARNYIGRLAMVRRDTATAIGGFRDGFDGAEEWDLLLRLSRANGRFARVPRCVYHRSSPDASLGAGGAAAIRDHWLALGQSVEIAESTSGYRATWPLPHEPLVSIVIPNRNSPAVIAACVNGILGATRYPHRELVIVDNGSTDAAVLELYASIERQGGVIVPFDRPFNFSAACNAGAARARGDLLLFLNNDVEVIDPGWLDELIRWALLPHVGVVGAKLLYPDGTIQHAGVVFGVDLIGHIFSRAREQTAGVFGSPDSYRNYLGVTGACQLMRKDVFSELGGFDERFRLAFSDVVLCMEAWRAGYRVVYTPHARLLHHESYTRKQDGWPEDLELLVRYLEANHFAEDRFFHPELNPRTALPSVRPPFEPTPPQVVHESIGRVLSAAAAAGR